MTLEEILKSIVSLSKEDLKQLKAQVDFLIGGLGNHTSIEKNGNGSYIRDAILLNLKRYVKVPNLNLLQTLDPFKTNTKLDLISSEIESLGKDQELSRAETLKLCGVLVDCAEANLKEREVPVSFKTMIFAMSDPKSLLDQSYPGYVGTSLFKGFVLKSKNADTDKVYTGECANSFMLRR